MTANLEHRLKLLFFPLALMAIGALALIPGVSAAYVGAFMLILLPGFFLDPKSEPFSGYSIAWHAAVVIFLLWTTLDLLLAGRGLHITLSYQLSFVILYRMLTPKKPRHYQEIWYWCLAALILAGFWAASILFVVVLVAFAVLSVFAFSYATMLREREGGAAPWRRLVKRGGAAISTAPPRNPTSTDAPFTVEAPVCSIPGRWGRRSRAGHPIAYLSALGALILILAAVIFVVLPRRSLMALATGPERLDSERDIVLTGLSDYITLGSLGRILQDDTEALRITITPPPASASSVYLRGGVLDFFDGLHWQKSPYLSRSLTARGAMDLSPLSDLRSPPAPDGRDRQVHQRIIYTGLTGNVVYALPNVAGLRLDRPATFSVSPAGVVTLRGAEREIQVESRPWRINHPQEEAILAPLFPAAAGGADDEQANPLYLQTPESLQTLRFRNLTARVTANALRPADKAAAIERYLSSNYAYTLDLRAYRTSNPVEEFVFDVRRGHCELFATAMVMMLRTAGVPARLASGFRGGLVQSDGDPGTLIVRNRDVHTWVEALLPGEGWRLFDPTPPAPLEVMSGSLIFLAGQEWIRALQRHANHFVFSFDREKQRSLYGAMRRAVAPVLAGGFSIESGGRPWRSFVPAAAAALAVILTVLALGRSPFLRRRQAARLRSAAGNRPDRPSPPDAAFLEWMRKRLIQALGGDPDRLPAGVTLREEVLALATGRPEPLLNEAGELAAVYYAVRFGRLALTPELRTQVRRRLAQLRKITG
ncbi:MAG: hypothetical protein Kow0059_12850 [Candidatus Sumerlaeia bacterium]